MDKGFRSGPGRFRLLLAVSALGVSSVVTQVTLTRELLNLYQGTELVLGIAVSAWLLLTGAGAWLGRRGPASGAGLPLALVAVALLPFVHIIVLRYTRFLLAPRGAVTDPRTLYLVLPLLTGPYCLISGYLLPAACTLLAKSGDAREIGKVYFADTVGDIAGGLLFSTVLVHLASNLGALYVPAALNLGAAFLLLCRQSRRWLMGVPALAALCVCVLWFSGIDHRSARRLFPHQTVAAQVESPYGRIAVTREDEQYTFYENGVPLAATTDAAEAEETVHFALCQVPRRPLAVLVVSGGLGGNLEEVLKYPVTRVDYVELDPAVIGIGRRFSNRFDDSRVTVHTGDGRRFVEEATTTYDAVIVDLPPPATMQVNRFYSAEFFAAVRAVLRPDGVVSYSLPGAENYLNRDLAGLYGTVASAARAAFSHVVGFPAGKAVFVAGDRPISRAIGDSLRLRDVRTRYVNDYFLSATLTPDRLQQFDRAVAFAGRPNSDLFPVAFRMQLRYWLGKFDHRIGWILAALAVASVILLLVGGPVETAIWSTGFVSMGAEICVLFLYQVLYGSVYLRYSLVVALFMAGLAAGSWWSNRRLLVSEAPAVEGSRILVRVDGGIAAFLLLSVVAVGWTSLWRSAAVLYGAVAAVAWLTGAQFPAAGVMRRGSGGETAGVLYAADLFGGAIGSFLVTMFLVPAVGVANTLVALAAIKGTAVVRLLWRRPG